MTKKINYGKVIAVVFLTILIWVWVDLRLDDEYTVSGATVSIAKSGDRSLWVSFEEDENLISSVGIENMDLKGQASKIRDVRRELNDGSLRFEFFLVPQEQGMVTTGEYPLDLLDFLKTSNLVRDHGITVESCQPATFMVKVVELVKKTLVVKCFDEDENPVKAERIEPPRVQMFVPPEWEGEKLVAKVTLAKSEIEQARLPDFEKRPYIQLLDGQRREAPAPVRIVTPSEDQLTDYVITKITPGFLLSDNLQGKYKIEVINLTDVMSPIKIRATLDAKQQYETKRYQVILEIDDEDKNTEADEPVRRLLVYNFPAKYIGSGEIILNQQPTTAQFKLVPVKPVEGVEQNP